MFCTEQAWLLVHVADRTEIPAHNLKIGILADVILGHLEHSEMEICYGAKRTARYKDNRLFLRVP